MAKLDGVGLRPIDERITRFLCATVHLDGSFANYVGATLLCPGRQGQAPEAEIDPIALARHAQLSLKRRKERDIQLLLVLIAVVAAAVLFFGAGAGQSLRLRQVTLFITALPVVGWAVALLVVYQHYAAARESALAAFKGTMGYARYAALPLEPLKEQRLHELHYANAVIYNSFSPFVGTGHTLDSWRINLGPAPGEGGSPDRVKISPLEVHEHLLRTVPAALNGGEETEERLRAESRLYVDGGTASSVVGLIPASRSPFIADRPAAIVPDSVLKQYTVDPNRTARTYCCFVENSGNGDVVVTVLVRAEIVGDTVYVEGRSQVLLPVQAGFKDVYWVSPDADQASAAVLRAALPRTAGLWLESPIRLIKGWLGDRRDERNLRDEGLRVLRSQPVNYGSSSSLREDAALPSDPGFYGAMDQVAYFRVITLQIFDSLTALLASAGITSPDLVTQRQLLLEQTFNVEGIRNAAPHGTANRALR